MQSFPGDALRTPVVWNSITSARLLKALTYPNLTGFFGIKSQCPSIQTKPFFKFNLHYEDREHGVRQEIDDRELGLVVFLDLTFMDSREVIIEDSEILPVVKPSLACGWPQWEYFYHGNRQMLQRRPFAFQRAGLTDHYCAHHPREIQNGSPRP